MIRLKTCECGLAMEDTRHYLLECHLHDQQRQVMIDNIEITYVNHDVPVCDRTLDIATLTVGNDHHNLETAHKIMNSVGRFITDTGHDV